MAYALMEALRRLGSKQTELARVQCSTIRLKLLKVGALVRITVRRVWVSMAGGDPHAELFAQACARLRVVPLRC
jgi:Transposase DDE domain group 1